MHSFVAIGSGGGVRTVAAVLVLAACRHPSPPPPALPPTSVARLSSLAPIDPKVHGAAYLTSVAVELQPGWGQFLDDCRLRLPASHILNRVGLSATAEISVDRAGRINAIKLASSGNPDFDRAVHEAIADAEPWAVPPEDLLSDDDLLHVRWLFARDRRQAGPATAEIVTVHLPLGAVIDRWVDDGELARAAHRLVSAPPAEADRTAATARLMVAALREALGSVDGVVRRAAVEAIGRAHATELAAEVRALLAVTNDAELRLTATAAVAALGDREAAQSLLQQLPADLADHAALALAETRALVGLGHGADVVLAISARLASDHTNPHAIALQALAIAPVPELADKLAMWFERGDARTRAAVCAAFVGYPPETAWPWIDRGLRDPDATVRATCALAAPSTRVPSLAGARLRALARDRDRRVRANAVAKLVTLDPLHFVHAAEDPATEVRVAYATALATASPTESEADLRTLIDDRDPDVRAAAWTAFGAAAVAPNDRGSLVARAARDSASAVRLAAVISIDDDEILSRLATTDDAADVRSAALVRLAGRRGREAIGALLLENLANAAPGGAERVRTALAWLLAR